MSKDGGGGKGCRHEQLEGVEVHYSGGGVLHRNGRVVVCSIFEEPEPVDHQCMPALSVSGTSWRESSRPIVGSNIVAWVREGYNSTWG